MPLTTPEQAGFSSARLKRIDPLMQGYVDRGELAGMIATVARSGQTVYLEKFGLMDREADKPMQLDAIFRIASMTKPITGAAAMMLYEEGHFHLNTPVSKFIPAFKNAKVLARETESGPELVDAEREVTFRHLFTHTAGLSYGWNENDPVDKLYREASRKAQADGVTPTLKIAMEAVAQLPLAFQPGARWRYSMSIDMLGYLVELISGLPFDVFLEERLFKPLGMPDTAFYVPAHKKDRVAAVYGHAPDKEGLQRNDMPLPTQRPVTWRPAAGCSPRWTITRASARCWSTAANSTAPAS